VREITVGNLTLTSLGALIINGSERTAVISDLHIGFEGVARLDGAAFPSVQKPYLLKKLSSLFERYSPDRVIINGDMKHEFSRNLRDEWNEVSFFMEWLKERAELTLIRGNHDNYLATIAGKHGLSLLDSVEVEGLLLTHGHRALETDKRVVIGHEHPTVRIKSAVGPLARVSCFLVSPSLVVLPAMSRFSLGGDILNTERRSYLSPLVTEERLKGADIFAMAGDEIMPLGPLSLLRRI